MGEWISVKDVSPKHCQEVIVCWAVSGKHEVHAATYSADFEYFYIFKTSLAAKDVTHWMPLPQPPESEAQNGNK